MVIFVKIIKTTEKKRSFKVRHWIFKNKRKKIAERSDIIIRRSTFDVRCSMLDVHHLKEI